MARVPPFGLSIEEQRALLAPLRVDLSVAVIRAKNPFNVGAIIRVAHSYLVREIFLVGTEPYYQRAAMGMHRYENIVECADDDELLGRVDGRPLYCVERDHADTTLWEVDYPKDLVLLFGNEDSGIPAKLLAAADRVISIPMYGVNHSFPVAIAAGMVLCDWARRRDPRGGDEAPGETPTGEGAEMSGPYRRLC